MDLGKSLKKLWAKPAASNVPSADVVDFKTVPLQEQLAHFVAKIKNIDYADLNELDFLLQSFGEFAEGNKDALFDVQKGRSFYNLIVKDEFSVSFKEMLDASFRCGDLKPCIDSFRETLMNAPSFLRSFLLQAEEGGTVSMATIYSDAVSLANKAIYHQEVEADKVVQLFPTNDAAVA